MRDYLYMAASAFALTAMPCVAQTSDADTSTSEQPSAGDSSLGLDTVVVTAQRREESLQDAAVAVDVVGGNDVRDANVTTVNSLQELVPSLIVDPADTGNLIFIRGIGNFTLANNADPATAVNYDEVYIARPASTDNYFFDLERVEVLKGPQGTLYGRNATAGAINIIPAKPKLGEFSGYFSGSVGNYDALSLEGALNAPIGDRMALRLSANRVEHEGYTKDGGSDQDVTSVRLQLLGEVTPDLTVRTSFDYTHQGGVGGGQTYSDQYTFDAATSSYTFAPITSIDPYSGIYSPESQAFRQTLIYGNVGASAPPLDTKPFKDNDYYGLHANIEWSTPAGVVTIIPSWRKDVSNFENTPGFEVLQDFETVVKSLEARFVSERFSIFDVTAGALLYDEELDANLVADLDTSLLYQDYTYATESQAAYMRATAHVSDRFRLTGGLRFTHDTKSADDQTTNMLIICAVVINGAPSCPDTPFFSLTPELEQQPIVPPAGSPPVPLGTTGALLLRLDPSLNDEISNDELTWRAAVEYDVLPSSLAYASVETGYRSGGFNPAGSLPYDPEYITAYTLGMKNELFGNRLRLNLEGFVWQYEDQQLSFVGLTPEGIPANQTTNIGELTAKGVEAEIMAMATENTLLSANILYLDSSYDKFTHQTPAQAGFPNSGCDVSVNAGNAALYDVDCAGKTAFNSPKWTLNLSAQQTVPLGNYEIVMSANTQYRSERYIFIHYTPDELVDAHWRSNAQVSYGPTDGAWKIAAYVRNIEGDRQPAFSAQHPFLPVNTQIFSAPRTYGVRLSAEF